MSNTPTASLSQAGVSIWLDDLSRERIETGSLARYVEEFNVVGVTTNPTIFANAISAQLGGAVNPADSLNNTDAADYAARIAACAARDTTPIEAVFELMCADVADACDILAPVYADTRGFDGRVSIEVSPTLADDAVGTTRQALQLWSQLNRPNAMIKIPATTSGLQAVTEATAQGISVNVTLIFSLTRYRQVINAYLTGLERAHAAGRDLSQIHSVASFFISRVDSQVDRLLDALSVEHQTNLADTGSTGLNAATEPGVTQTASLRGRAGLANARLAYEIFEQSFASERAHTLLAVGANVQRPLWASTGVKDPTLPDTLYVSELVAPGVVNTMPEATLLAFADHGTVPQDTITASYRDSDAILNELDRFGIDYATVTADLEVEGLHKFDLSWAELMTTVSQALQATP